MSHVEDSGNPELEKGANQGRPSYSCVLLVLRLLCRYCIISDCNPDLPRGACTTYFKEQLLVCLNRVVDSER